MSEIKLPNRMSIKMASRLCFLLPLVLLISSAGCKTRTEDDNATNVFVEIISLAASSSDFQGAGEEVTDLFSDVCFATDTVPPCTVFNDNGIVTFRAFLKDRSQTTSLINDITFERYRVTYIRADGRNVPGVDVPFPFDGASNFTVPADATDVTRAFIVVRHQAKRESPLIEMALNASGILSVIAQIDFFGRDISGRPITVTGFLNITFGDFANED